MTENVGKPSWLYSVSISLDGRLKKIERDMTLSDYINLMWDLKTKAFITYSGVTINKMHILMVDTDISPIVVMSVNDFIHDQKENAFNLGMSREEVYNRWCENRPEQWEYNRNKFTIKKGLRDGN